MCRSWSLRMKFKKKWKSSLAESIPSRSYLTHCAVFWQNCAPTTDSSLPPQPHLHLQRQHCTNPLWSSPLPYLSARVPPGNILSFENIPIRLVSVERKSVHHHSKLKDFLSVQHTPFLWLFLVFCSAQKFQHRHRSESVLRFHHGFPRWSCHQITVLVNSLSPSGTYMNRLTASLNPCSYFKGE